MKLKTWLSEMGIRQADLARELGIDPTRISKFVVGAQRLSDGQIVDLSNFLGVSIEALLTNNLNMEENNVRTKKS